MLRDTRIAILGGGLAGLTLGGLLQRAGFSSVTIYEQSSAFSRIGAGIILGASVAKVLRRLDLDADVASTGIRPDAFVSRACDSGETLYELPLDETLEQRFGGPFVNIHRADLHRLLQKPIAPETIRFGHKLIDVDDKTTSVRLHFENGVIAEADIVIGADGIRSQLREIVQGVEEPRYIGRIAPRSVFPADRLHTTLVRDCTKWWAADRHLLAYYMTQRRDEFYVMAAIPAESWDHEEATVKGHRDDLVAAFEGSHPDLLRVVEAVTEVTVWPIYDRPRNDRWSNGRIVLMGDACHAVRPFMAAGGAMAIEDAATLAMTLTDCTDHLSVFARYSDARIPRVAEVQRISIENSWMHGPTEIDWFFAYDPWVLPAVTASRKP